MYKYTCVCVCVLTRLVIAWSNDSIDEKLTITKHS